MASGPINTGFGLLIAIPSLIAHRHYRRWWTTSSSRWNRQAVKLVELATERGNDPRTLLRRATRSIASFPEGRTGGRTLPL